MSPISFAQRLAGASKVLAIFVVVALFAAVVLVFNRGGGDRTITADFTQTTSLYEGSEVRVLGVPVGTVTELEPKGEFIRATIEVDSDVDLPNDVKAVIVSPAIVGDRFVQLAPAYSGGEKLANAAHLDTDRTAVPVELDQVYESIDDLTVALGPDGANADGALSDLVSSSADQLEGQGAQLNETLKNFGQFTTTLSDNSDELFAGVRQVEVLQRQHRGRRRGARDRARGPRSDAVDPDHGAHQRRVARERQPLHPARQRGQPQVARRGARLP